METQRLPSASWVDAAFDASWRAPGGADDRAADPSLQESSDRVDAADSASLVAQIETLLLALNSRACSPEAWAFYRQAGVDAVARKWECDPFRWEGAASERGRIAVDWAFLVPLAPRQRARACSLVHLALVNAACDLPDLDYGQ
jgi:hypothetical protein